MSEVFSEAVSDSLRDGVAERICSHMNEDHADAVLLYAKAFSNLTDATAAQMLSIDSEGMNLNAQVNGEAVPVRIQFDHVLKDAEDAHHTLIDMVKQARMQAKQTAS
ncbi:MAG TPA: heme iron utilization protein [Cyanobacteria bacterium UBA11372]|nr:heme iron utilization protein [Cyanobacteria bacterium UBA11372]